MSPIYVDGVEYTPESILRVTTAERTALSPDVGKIVYDTDDLLTYSWDGSEWVEHEGGGGGSLPVPSWTDDSTEAQAQYKAILTQLRLENEDLTFKVTRRDTVETYATASNAFYGAQWMPNVNIVFFAPYQETHTQYYDVGVDRFTNIANITAQDWVGGCYHPLVHRYYLCPAQEASTTWSYYQDRFKFDALGDNLKDYSAQGLTGTVFYYMGAAWHNALQRIYFVPSGLSNANWDYIDSAGNHQTYARPYTPTAYEYDGAVWHPPTQRLYMMPWGRCNDPDWHYIDASGTWVEYTHGITVPTDAFRGGVYDPVNGYIWATPYANSNTNTWIYLDETGTWQTYTPDFQSVATNGYTHGVFVPSVSKIFFAPYDQGNQNKWHGIDCVSKTVFELPIDSSYGGALAGCSSCVYIPGEDMIMYTPLASWTGKYVHFIRFSNKPVARDVGMHMAFISR